MNLRTVLLLLGVLTIASAQDERKPIVLKINKPPEQDRARNGIQTLCTFQNSKTKMSTVNSMTLLRSETGKKADYKPIATVTPKSRTSGLGPQIHVAGGISQGSVSAVIAYYKEPNKGYCFYYKCLIEGTDKMGRQRSYYRTLKDRCKTDKPKPKTCCADLAERLNNITEEIKNSAQASPALPVSFLEAANKLASIDRQKYDVSSVYNGKVYIMTKTDEVFNVNLGINACLKADGYLVEVDDIKEEVFLASFTRRKAGTGKIVYTGGNDIATEGTFVTQHRGQKPVAENLIWARHQPDNAGDGEDCMTVSMRGLSDNNCSLSGRFICEIGLI